MERATGSPLPAADQNRFSAGFGRDFSHVRVHTGERAARSAAALDARAYTIGQHIVFGHGQSTASDGGRLLAHELAHVVQQEGAPDLQRSAVSQPQDASEREADAAADAVLSGLQTAEASAAPDATELPSVASPAPQPLAAGFGATSGALLPEACPPPTELDCTPANSSPGNVTNTLWFGQDSAALSARQRGEIDAVAAGWNALGGGAVVRVDGYASAEGACAYNWSLSCRRARAVARELERPSDGSAGIPSGTLDVLANGESGAGGPALAANRRATISLPVPPPPPPAAPAPSCPLPRLLGAARGCGSGADFAHFDHPTISAGSTARLAAWAAARPLSRGPFRSLVSNIECEVEMDAVLSGLAGGDGHFAFAHFAAGGGTTVSHSGTSSLGAMALASGSFGATVGSVRAAIETQLSAQAASGTLDPCALAVTPPATFFSFSDGRPLKAVIGGTQGETLFLQAFSGSATTRSYTAELRFIICDDFGVDESDLYAPGLFAFWVLQHERSATRYAPYINKLDLVVPVSGTF